MLVGIWLGAVVYIRTRYAQDDHSPLFFFPEEQQYVAGTKLADISCAGIGVQFFHQRRVKRVEIDTREPVK